MYMMLVVDSNIKI